MPVLTEILTVLGCSVGGAGVGVLINTIKAYQTKKKNEKNVVQGKRKRPDESNNTSDTSDSHKEKTLRPESGQDYVDLFRHGMHFTRIAKYLNPQNPDHTKALKTSRRFLSRMLQLQAESMEVKTPYWSNKGAITFNHHKFLEWIKTLEHELRNTLTTLTELPVEVQESLTHLKESAEAIRYNRNLAKEK